MPSKSSLPLGVLALVFVALALGLEPAAAGNGGFAPVPPESPNAQRAIDAYWFVTAFAAAIFVLVQAVLITFIVRYRRRRGARDAEGPQVHGSTRLEVLWSTAPVLILVAIAGFVFYKLPGITGPPSASAADRLTVTVIGRQFYWQYEYPNGAIAIDRLRAPQRRDVRVLVTSPPYDVIHSWWVPPVGGKFDAIPGQVNQTWFHAKKTGVFEGRCGELCGIKHAQMHADVEVVSQAEFDTWVEERAREIEAGTGSGSFGEELYDGACAKCHGLEGQGGYGPQIANSTLLDDETAIERLLTNGRGAMPPVGRGWRKQQMSVMTSYLKERFRSGG